MAAFVKAIEDTGRKTLIIAGTLTSVCLAFPTVCGVAAGYKVYDVVDASGTEIFATQLADLTRVAGNFPDLRFILPLKGWPIDLTKRGFQ